MATWSAISSADFRGSSAAVTQKFIDAINKTDASLAIIDGDLCTSISACPSGYDPAGFKSKITGKTVYILAGNHEGGTCSGCEDNVVKTFNGIDFVLLGCGDSSECTTRPNAFNWSLIRDTVPTMVVAHTNFFNLCAGSHSDKATIRAKIDAKPSVVGGISGHNHQVAVGGPAGRIYVQESSPTGSPPLYCDAGQGVGVGTMGYWLFDDTIVGQLTVKYTHLNVVDTANVATFVRPTSWVKTIVYTGGGGEEVYNKCIGGICTQVSGIGQNECSVVGQACGGGGITGCTGCDLNTNYCLGGQCISKKDVLYAGAIIGGALVIKMILKSRK